MGTSAVGNRYQTTDEDRSGLEDKVRGVMNCIMCDIAIALLNLRVVRGQLIRLSIQIQSAFTPRT
jgi:hypothetical protein